MHARRTRPIRRSLALTLAGLVSIGASLPVLAQAPTQATPDPPQVAGCRIFPADSIWNTRVDTLPVDPSSDAYIATIGADGGLRADFAAGLWEGKPIGIPWVDVPADQPPVAVAFGYDDESDPGPYPIPADAPIEGGPNGDGDRHVLVVQRDACTLYELFNAFPQDDGTWAADSGAVYDLASHALRPDGWTSADAAGLPILPGLTRFDDVATGEIRHALRFTVPETRRAYVWPARHFASDLTGSEYPPMGQRFRLRAAFDLTGYAPQAQVILRALQAYGMILADNGQPWFISGVPDERWDDEALAELRQVLGSDLEAVDVSSLMVDPDSGQARTPDSTGSSPLTGASSEHGEPAPDLFVDASNDTGVEDGSAKAPYSTPQAAIRAASDRATIAVAAGTYPGSIRIQGRTIDLFGGYSGDFTVRDPALNVTTLQGDGTDSVVALIDAGTSTIDGFRITGGTRSLVPEYGDLGAGLYVSGGAPTISNNRIEGNDARPPEPSGEDPVGGGIYATDSNISILDNVIRANVAGRGAGIAINGGRVLIEGNAVQDNVGVSDHGGGVYIASPDARVTRNLIAGNEIGRELGYGWGGGIVVYGQGTFAALAFNDVTGNFAPSVGGGVFVDDGARATLDHELIHDNFCPTGGTTGGVGIYVDGYDRIGSEVTLNHVTVAGHDCESQGGNGLYVEVHSKATIANSIFWANGGDDLFVDATSQVNATFTTSDEPMPGRGNSSVDPLFAYAERADYHLRSAAGRWDPTAGDGAGAWVLDTEDSPAIDAADPDASFENEPTPNGARAEMGAYGNTPEASRSSPT